MTGFCWVSIQSVDPLQANHYPASKDTVLGKTISHYRVVEAIGQGGMGVVYRAEDERLGRDVALKFLPEELSGDKQALERFKREARAASALNHPNICTIYDVGEADGRSFIAMEFLQGENLQRRTAGRPLPSAEILEIGLQLAGALDAAHARALFIATSSQPTSSWTRRV